ncbi:hypothetical protein B9Z55_010462 [Caenorhabditis nigoni]|uniref:Uncharacterized protein n=1 Tax=Caenorhabditis nigoni TaxID=1611254 RepID=A0A2G5UFX2_9PELO|nr:hypothetical protein B9Z55_010462 [Caenorhabditis nigoni]
MSSFATRSNESISSKIKQSYFVHSTPEGLNGAQYLAVNREGTIIYGLRIRVELSIIEAPGEVPEVITTATEKTVCKYHVASGSSKTFQLDDDFDPLLLTRVLEFYTISDNLVVILCYDSEHCQFIQVLMHLEHEKEWAQSVVYRRKTVSRLAGPPIVNLSFLDKGKILLCGVRGAEDGQNERMSMSIAADPLNSFNQQDEDFSNLMEEFNKFLITRPPDTDGKSLISLFLLNLDQDQISVLLSEVDPNDPNSEAIFATNCIGIINRKDKGFSVERLDDSVISSTGEPLKVTSIANMKTKGGSVWMTFSVTDIEKLKTIYWRCKHLYVRVMLRLMIMGFHGSIYLWRFDNGFTFYCLTRILTFLHGPTMIQYMHHRKNSTCVIWIFKEDASSDMIMQQEFKKIKEIQMRLISLSASMLIHLVGLSCLIIQLTNAKNQK